MVRKSRPGKREEREELWLVIRRERGEGASSWFDSEVEVVGSHIKRNFGYFKSVLDTPCRLT
jgi:hypothetical protein